MATSGQFNRTQMESIPRAGQRTTTGSDKGKDVRIEISRIIQEVPHSCKVLRLDAAMWLKYHNDLSQ